MEADFIAKELHLLTLIRDPEVTSDEVFFFLSFVLTQLKRRLIVEKKIPQVRLLKYHNPGIHVHDYTDLNNIVII